MGCLGSIPYDFYIKVYGKGDFYGDTALSLPTFSIDSIIAKEISCRVLMLNCLNLYYQDFWKDVYEPSFKEFTWAKKDSRLNNEKFQNLSEVLVFDSVLRTDYARRQAQIEIDVLVSMLLGLSLEELLNIYRVQFPILQQHERDTYYDYTGRIVFAKNNALTNVGFTKKEWKEIKGVHDLSRVYRNFCDNTTPNGPVERCIEYVAPFDCCNREKDYETVWSFFEKKYGHLNDK